MLRRRVKVTWWALVFVAGCGARPPEIVPAEGVVLLNDVPLPKAKVRFFPQFDNSSEYMAQGITDDKGRFVLMCRGQPGACAGESLVTVTDEDIPTELTLPTARAELGAYLESLKNRPIPTLYRDVSETPIRITISGDQKDYKIELRR